jgi:hypothetical protein
LFKSAVKRSLTNAGERRLVDLTVLSFGQLLSFEHPLDAAAIIYRSQCACLVLEEQPALSGNSLKRAE